MVPVPDAVLAPPGMRTDNPGEQQQ